MMDDGLVTVGVDAIRRATRGTSAIPQGLPSFSLSAKSFSGHWPLTARRCACLKQSHLARYVSEFVAIIGWNLLSA